MLAIIDLLGLILSFAGALWAAYLEFPASHKDYVASTGDAVVVGSDEEHEHNLAAQRCKSVWLAQALGVLSAGFALQLVAALVPLLAG